MLNPPLDPAPRKQAADKVPKSSSASGQVPNSSDFWRHKTLDELIAEQGTQPIDDVEAFVEEISGIWPEEESVDEFIAWYRRGRRTGRYD